MTAEHPLFAVGAGWVTAGALAPGDAIRNADLRELRVLSAELDPTPTRVHNLEVEGAHTYYAGELGAWGHNGFGAYVIRIGGQVYVGKGCERRMRKNLRRFIREFGADALESFAHYGGLGSDRASFKKEHELMCDLGWSGPGTDGFLNLAGSPGAKF